MTSSVSLKISSSSYVESLRVNLFFLSLLKIIVSPRKSYSELESIMLFLSLRDIASKAFYALRT